MFAHHKLMLDAIEELIFTKEILYVRIDGQDDNKSKQEKINKFQEDPKVRIGILSLTAVGIGFTLTASHTVVFAEVLAYIIYFHFRFHFRFHFHFHLHPCKMRPP